MSDSELLLGYYKQRLWSLQKQAVVSNVVTALRGVHDRRDENGKTATQMLVAKRELREVTAMVVALDNRIQREKAPKRQDEEALSDEDEDEGFGEQYGECELQAAASLLVDKTPPVNHRSNVDDVTGVEVDEATSTNSIASSEVASTTAKESAAGHLRSRRQRSAQYAPPKRTQARRDGGRGRRVLLRGLQRQLWEKSR